MGEGSGKVWAALALFFAAPFLLIARSFDLDSAWRFVFVEALIMVSPVIAFGLTEAADAASESTLTTGRKILTSAFLGGLPTLVAAYPLSPWFPGAWYGVAVLWLFLCSLPPLLWAFVPALRRGAIAKIGRDLGAGKRMVQAEGRPARLIGEDEDKAEGEETVAMTDEARAALGLPPKTPRP